MSSLFDDGFVDPDELDGQACYQSSVNASVNTFSTIPAQQRVSAAPDTQMDSLRRAATEQSQQVVECAPASQMINDLRNGTEHATKAISVAVLCKYGNLCAEGVTTNFSREVIESICKVHARDSDDRSLRRGDIAKTLITEISLHSTFSGHDVPVGIVGQGSMQGKLYSLAHNTGRESGKGNRMLCLVYPGSHHFEKPKIIFSRVRPAMIQMARIVGSFKVADLEQGLQEIKIDGAQSQWLVPQRNFLYTFIQKMAQKWVIPWDRLMEIGGKKMIPDDVVRKVITVLRAMEADLRQNTHDLGGLSFGFASICAGGGAVTSGFITPDTDILIQMNLMIRYTFLHPHTLLVNAPSG